MYVEVSGSEELYVAIRRCLPASAGVWAISEPGDDGACWPAEKVLSRAGELGCRRLHSPKKFSGGDPPSRECP